MAGAGQQWWRRWKPAVEIEPEASGAARVSRGCAGERKEAMQQGIGGGDHVGAVPGRGGAGAGRQRPERTMATAAHHHGREKGIEREVK